MKKIILTGILLSMSLFCMTIFAEEKRYSFKDFSEIQYSIPGTMYLTQADQYQIVLKATKRQMGKIEIQKRGNSLIIDEKWSLFGSRLISLKGIEIHISVPVLNAVTASSSGSVHGLTTFTSAKKMQLRTSSSGDIALSAQADNVEAICTSSGSIRLSGKVASLKLKTSSRGDIDFSGKITEYLQATTSSFGEIRCESSPAFVVPESRLKTSSFGDITVIGKGNLVEAKSSSGGNLRLGDFQCKSMKVDLSSRGNAYINVTEYLEMKTTSKGKIVNHGSPRIK